MIDFHEITLADKGWIEDVLKDAGERGIDYGFGAMYAWKRYYNTKVAEVCGCFTAFMEYEGEYYYMCPSGGCVNEAVLELARDAEERGIRLTMVSAAGNDIELLEEYFPGLFSYTLDRDSSEYVYDINDLADLKGRRFHGKKNHVNRFFKDNPDWHVEPVTKDNVDICRELDKAWGAEHTDADGAESLPFEDLALKCCFDHIEQFGLLGLILFVGDIPVAFTLGSPLPIGDEVDVMFEKALAEVDGAYSVINMEFARYVRENCPEVKYLNREEDMGLEGLRTAKESYHPVMMVDKYIAEIKETDE